MNIMLSLQKWGNGTGVRIPKKVVQAAKLQLNQPLNITLQNNSIILTPIADNDLTLESMLQGVTPDQINGEVDWSADIGVEKYE
ncbi:MAG TPA: AbrB/MazE/SpoVT family DNA-binding domain-containing protein [Candidatus Saccharimonadales bacterium]|nr:AbrB/MazE/SpoVT family DNA-binding domain-containing protein [Candidatus Saccharimonadales bacterium]